MPINRKGAVLASAAVLLITSQAFATNIVPTVTGSPKPVKCYGVNSCKGKGQCGSKANHACAGQNSCKGKSWIFLPLEECKKKGGTL